MSNINKLFNLFILFIFLLFFSSQINSNNLAVIDIEQVVSKSTAFIDFIKKIEDDQIDHKKNFQKKEKELQNQYNEIQDSKIVLSEEEYQNSTNLYNIKLNSFNQEINNFNNHYESQISKYRNLIIENALNIIREYALTNELDLILDSKNYIMASNSINITEIVLKKVNNLKIDINLEPY